MCITFIIVRLSSFSEAAQGKQKWWGYVGESHKNSSEQTLKNAHIETISVHVFRGIPNVSLLL